MDASKIVNDNMTLEEKLKAIDEAMKEYQVQFNKNSGRVLDTPVDPSMLTICDGCE